MVQLTYNLLFLTDNKKKHYKRKGSVEEVKGVDTLDDLEFHRLFGAGTFGRVWIVSPLGKRAAYALKIQSKRELLDQRQAGGAQRERSVMVKLDHPFVCKLISTFQDEACIYMLIQFVQGGELLNLIQGGDAYGGLPESAAKFFAAVMLEGLTHMHQRQIVYRDLKRKLHSMFVFLFSCIAYPLIHSHFPRKLFQLKMF